jgi:hypothetical protein
MSRMDYWESQLADARATGDQGRVLSTLCSWLMAERVRARPEDQGERVTFWVGQVCDQMETAARLLAGLGEWSPGPPLPHSG